MGSVWGPLGSRWSRCESKPDWINFLNGTQIHHSDGRSIGFRHLAWVGDSLKQTFVSLWLIWMSQIQSVLWNCSISVHCCVLREWGLGEWMRETENKWERKWVYMGLNMIYFHRIQIADRWMLSVLNGSKYIIIRNKALKCSWNVDHEESKLPTQVLTQMFNS